MLDTLLLATAIPSALLLAAPSSVQAAIEITPKVCVVSDQSEPCATTIHLEWSLNEAKDVCLVENKRTLKCWHGQYQGALQYEAQVALPATFYLTHANTGEVLSSAELSLQTTKSTRRRLRSVWGLF